MSVRKSRSAKLFSAQVLPLEQRMLLTSFNVSNPITYYADFVGSTASVGPDGYEDIALNLSGLPNTTAGLVIYS